MTTEQRNAERQSQCECNRNAVVANNLLLEKLKSERAQCITKMDLSRLQIVTISIKQIEDENLGFLAINRELGYPDDEKPKSLRDRQTIISSSPVRRKDSKALEIIQVQKG